MTSQSDSAETEREHIRPEQHHRAHLRFGERLADSAGVAANKIQLELPQVVVRDVNIREFAEAGVDPVNNRVARDDLFDDSCGKQECADALMARFAQAHRQLPLQRSQRVSVPGRLIPSAHLNRYQLNR